MKDAGNIIHSRKSVENVKNLFLFQLLFRWLRSLYAFIFLLLFCLLACNSASIFCTNVPIPAKLSPVPAGFLPENDSEKSRKFFSAPSSTKMASLLYSVKEDSPSAKLKSHLHLLHQNPILAVYRPRRRIKQKRAVRILSSQLIAKNFEARVRNFFTDNSCKFIFFMTWISSVESFGNREFFAIESLFKAHPDGCLIIASNSLDSKIGKKILRPFLNKGFKVIAISPDFNCLFKGTAAQSWFNRLKRGNVNPGGVSLGQNLSNLLRLGLLYRFGGIYLDTDVVVLRSFEGLSNAIGAQTIDLESGNWSRLNNAVMIFDEGHPLVYKFIQEFALTFDGNKWGHNGPYLVSRVAWRVRGRAGYNFTVLPPTAFYPVDWSKIGSLFQGPKSLSHSKWLIMKLSHIRDRSFALHLWNKQSRGFEIEKGSIIQQIMFSSCVFCNSSLLTV